MTIVIGDYEVPFPGRVNPRPAKAKLLTGAPPQEVVDAIEAGNTSITRRLEFFEADNVTPWYADDDQYSRLIEGNVSVDYSRSERRAIDVTLDNSDNRLRPNPSKGLWYDKIIKPYRGVRYAADSRPPRVVVIEEQGVNSSYTFRSILAQLGFSRTEVRTDITSADQLRDYEIVVSYKTTGASTKSALLKAAYDAGKAILTLGIGNSTAEVPLYQTTTSSASRLWGYDPVQNDTLLHGGWSGDDYGAATGRAVTALAATATPVATYLDGATLHYVATIEEGASGGRWFDYHLPQIGTDARTLLKNGMNWLWNFEPYREWETPLGEFMIDSLSEVNFPHHTKVTGRDFTKKCLTSKLEENMRFPAGTLVVDLVRALAANAGITKFKLPKSNETLGRRLDIARGTERFTVMKQACEINDFELFFDIKGNLTMRSFRDPSFSALNWTFKTGPDGNLVSWERSTNDSRLYNHIIVTGEREESGQLPFFGQARNKEPNSPTRIERIGDRSYFFTSSFFTSDAQCRKYARNLLKIHALETYEISWTAINYPWLEAGEVVGFLDPNRDESEPTRFLMDSLTIPLGLGPMSATGKRVTFVEDYDIVAQDDLTTGGAGLTV